MNQHLPLARTEYIVCPLAQPYLLSPMGTAPRTEQFQLEYVLCDVPTICLDEIIFAQLDGVLSLNYCFI